MSIERQSPGASTPSGPSIALAITGASGAIYAVRTLAALLTRGVHVFLAGKILSALGFDHDLFPPWTGRVGP
jgi:3-polyprenyl-4-hydroxybenzoate decarboxylase